MAPLVCWELLLNFLGVIPDHMVELLICLMCSHSVSNENTLVNIRLVVIRSLLIVIVMVMSYLCLYLRLESAAKISREYET